MYFMNIADILRLIVTRAGNFDTTREPDTKLSGLGLLLTGLGRKRLRLFILVGLGRVAGHPRVSRQTRLTLFFFLFFFSFFLLIFT